MKICSKCGIEKDETDFWKRNNRKSGVNSECKECAKKRRTENYRTKNEEFRKKRKIYYLANREKFIKIQTEYSRRKLENKDPKILARRKVNDSLKRKKIEKHENCQICGIMNKLQAHHCDYNKKLDIIWVCLECHLMIHEGLKKRN